MSLPRDARRVSTTAPIARASVMPQLSQASAVRQVNGSSLAQPAQQGDAAE